MGIQLSGLLRAIKNIFIRFICFMIFMIMLAFFTTVTTLSSSTSSSRNSNVVLAASEAKTATPRPTRAPEATEIPEPTSDHSATLASNINLRSGPSTAFDIQTTIAAESRVQVIAKKTFEGERWYEVEWNGSQGWLSGSVFAPNDELIATLPENTTSYTKPTPIPAPVAPAPAPVANCDPSYPDICLPPYGPDLDCPEIPYRRFRVIGVDRHRFDGDNDGIGCER